MGTELPDVQMHLQDRPKCQHGTAAGKEKGGRYTTNQSLVDGFSIISPDFPNPRDGQIFGARKNMGPVRSDHFLHSEITCFDC